MARRLELDVSYASRSPWVPSSQRLSEWAEAALSPVAKRSVLSVRKDKPLSAHWAHLTIHGVLHLMGFDHEDASEAGKMAAREIQILDRLGFSDPYR